MAIALTTYPSARNDATEDRWSNLMRRLFTDGVHAATSDTNEFRPYGDSTGMQMKIDTGAANISGFYTEMSSFATLSIAAADATRDRIDLAVLRLDRTSPVTIYVDVKTGTPATTPSAPSLTSSSSITEVPLGKIQVGHGVSTIRSQDVIDARAYCLPWMTEPPGVPVPFLGTVAPAGYLMVAGQTGLSGATYPILCSMLNPGGSTFSLPNMGGRVPVGVDGSHGLLATGGSLTHTLLESELTPHSHDPVKSGSSYEMVVSSGHGEINQIGFSTAGGNVNVTYSPMGATGGGAPFPVEQPWIGLNWIVRAC